MPTKESNHCGEYNSTNCGNDWFCCNNTQDMMHEVPENISYECRDSRFAKCWLTKEYEDRMTIIREQVTKFSEQYKRNETSLRYFTAHGVNHSKTVENILYRLITGAKFALLSEHERFYLIAGAWLHDIGMYAEGISSEIFSPDELRGNHHVYSQKMISENYSLLGVREHEVSIFTTHAHFHRQKEDIELCREIITCNRISIRIRLLCAYLRLADALHVDQSRAEDEEYAIALTYNMPHSSKMHWIKSRLVLGIDINQALSKITVHLKYPMNIENEFSGNQNKKEKMEDFDKKLRKIYRMFILNPLKREVDSLKKVLIENQITIFINVDEEIHNIFFKKKFLKEIHSIADAELGMRKPSSTTMVNGILETIINIIVEHNKEKAKITHDDSKQKEQSLVKNTHKQIKNFTDPMLEMLDKEKPCHFMARKLLEDVNAVILKPKCVKFKRALRDTIKRRLFLYKQTIARNHATHVCDVLFSRMNTACTENKKDSLDFLGSYIELYRNLSYYDSTLIRVQASRYLEDILCNRKNNFAHWQVSKIVETIFFKIISSDVFTKYVEFSTISPCPNGPEKRFSCIVTENNYSKNEKPSSEDFSCAEIPDILGILVYGYSTTVIESLCGFRDVIINRLLRLLVNYSVYSKSRRRKVPDIGVDPVITLLSDSRGKNRIEEIVSAHIQIYVCEGQPKNILEDGEVRYHDGYEYEQALHERNFKNTVIVADSVSGTLISQYYAVKTTAKLINGNGLRKTFSMPNAKFKSPQSIIERLPSSALETLESMLKIDGNKADSMFHTPRCEALDQCKDCIPSRASISSCSVQMDLTISMCTILLDIVLIFPMRS